MQRNLLFDNFRWTLRNHVMILKVFFDILPFFWCVCVCGKIGRL